MSKITILAIDLAKHVFQLYGVDERGVNVLQRRLGRSQLLQVVAQIPPCQVVMEACGGAHCWARQIRALGHEVRLLAGHHVKPFNLAQKNDRNDAQAIARAARQPDLPTVAVKSEEQQAVLAIHRIRERLLKERIALTNQLQGLMGEFGYALPRGLGPLRQSVHTLLAEGHLPALLQLPLTEQLEHLSQIESRLKALTRSIEQMAKVSRGCQRLMQHRGVGPITATAFIAELADPQAFKNGRQVGAWLGLVPRQHSSGVRHKLLGITKRGDTYLRKLLIHAARAALRFAPRYQDQMSRWSLQVQQRRGTNRAVVALANKTARRLWATLRYEDFLLADCKGF